MACRNKSKLYVQDVTLRDGMHSIRHQYHLETVRDIARALDRAHLDAIEICHGDGITGATFNYGFGAHDDGEWISAVAEECQNAVVTVLLLPGIGTVHDLKQAYEAGARSVRIATHCTEADVSKQHIEAACALGMDTVGFLMMAHMAPVETLVEQAKLMESYGAECVYVTDFGRRPASRPVRRARRNHHDRGTDAGSQAASHREGHRRDRGIDRRPARSRSASFCERFPRCTSGRGARPRKGPKRNAADRRIRQPLMGHARHPARWPCALEVDDFKST